LAAYDTGRTRVFGHCAASTGIEPFMTREPYASATRVFWIVDNGSSHRGQVAIDRLAKRFPNAVMVHTPRHASWLNLVVRHEVAWAQWYAPKEVRLMSKV
jgi:hypothetical protein